MEAYIKFVKGTNQKYIDNNNDVNLPLLQISLMPVGTGLPSPATLLFNRPIRALFPQMNREPININVDKEHCETLKVHHDKYLKGSDRHKGSLSFLIGSIVGM